MGSRAQALPRNLAASDLSSSSSQSLSLQAKQLLGFQGAVPAQSPQVRLGAGRHHSILCPEARIRHLVPHSFNTPLSIEHSQIIHLADIYWAPVSVGHWTRDWKLKNEPSQACPGEDSQWETLGGQPLGKWLSGPCAVMLFPIFFSSNGVALGIYLASTFNNLHGPQHMFIIGIKEHWNYNYPTIRNAWKHLEVHDLIISCQFSSLSLAIQSHNGDIGQINEKPA